MGEFFPANGFRLKRPFWHERQKIAFDRSCDAPKFALFHEPRCGKSDIVVATAARQHSLHKLWGVLAITWPAGGHIPWVRDAFPAACPVPWLGLIWDSQRVNSKSFKREFDELLKYRGLAVLSINIEALVSERCREHIGRFAAARKQIMAAGDEISAICNSDARRSKIMHNIGALPFVVMWRILDGTPVDKKGPLDYYSEFAFMGRELLGYPNEVEYRAHYAEIKTSGRAAYWQEVKRLTTLAEQRGYQDARGWAERTAKSGALIIDPDTKKKRRLTPGRDFWTDIVKDDSGFPIFKNMDEMHARIDPITDRCTFKQAFPNSKDIIFSKRYFELTAEQRRVYKEVEDEYRATLIDGTVIDAKHHLVRVLRLQQISSNYFPDQKVISLHEPCQGMGCELCGDSGIVESDLPLRFIDPKCNPRMDALELELSEGRPTIVWVRFVQDGKLAMLAAERAGMSPVPYFGPMTGSQKLKSWESFQEKREAGCIVANWTRGSRAIRMDAAEKHVACSNQWSFRTRQQGELRSEHGSKSGFATSFIDVLGSNTVDDRLILPALREGLDVSTYVMQDAKREWI